MTSTRRSRLRGLRDRLSGDGGFALVEVMVSAVLVIVFAIATLNIVDTSGRASTATRMRATATGLAQQDQDGMRVMSIGQLNLRDVTYPKTVAGVTFSIHSVAQWMRDSGKATCDTSTNRVEYLKTTSYVTWPGHTNDPVTVESYISPGVEAISKGALMVKLHTDPGAGVAGVTVRLSSGQAADTDQSGCALFTGLDAGTVTASWDGTQNDYVDRNGIQTPSENVVIGAGQTAQIDRLWDKAGSAVVRWIDENTQAVVPTTMSSPNGGIGAGVVNSLITKPTVAALPQVRLFDDQTTSVALNTPLDPPIAPVTIAGQTTKVTELFPFTQAYNIFAGGCAANIPTAYQTSYVIPTVTVPAGADSAQVDVKLSTVSIALTNRPPSGGTVQKIKLINKDGSVNCLDTAPIATASPTSSNIVLRVPFGQYTVCVQQVTSGSNYTSTSNTVNAYPPTAPRPITIDTNTTSWTRNSTC